MNEKSTKANDLLLLLFDLSVINSNEKVIQLFVDAVQDIWPGIGAIYVLSKTPDSDLDFPISVSGSHIGKLHLKFPDEIKGSDEELLKQACALLAVILKRNEQSELLSQGKRKLNNPAGQHLNIQTDEAEKGNYSESKEQEAIDEIRHLLEVAEKSRRVLLSILEDETKARQELRELNEKLEQRIAESTTELLDLYNNAPCGYHSLDGNGVFELINDTELRWLGYSREEIIGKIKFSDIISEANQEVFSRNFPLLRDRGWVYDLEFDMIRKDGSVLPVLLNATSIKDNQGKYLRSRSTIIDHTARKKAEVSLREAHNGLEAANKELEAFSYSVSHDLRAPVRALDGFARILLEDYSASLDAEGTRMLHVIMDNATKMGNLIDDLLSFSRLNKVQLKNSPIDMAFMVQEVYNEIVPVAEKDKIEFILQNIPEGYGDPAMIRQVWVNLISNALKFSSKKPKRIIEVGSMVVNDRNTYFVKDNGAGFDKNYADKLFGVFERLHSARDFEGNGVGLAIVQRILQRMGGSIYAESKVGEGAVFYFTVL